MGEANVTSPWESRPEHLLPILFLCPCCSQDCFSLFFPQYLGNIFPFLNVFTEVPIVWLVASAVVSVSVGEPAGTGCVQHRAATGLLTEATPQPSLTKLHWDAQYIFPNGKH